MPPVIYYANGFIPMGLNRVKLFKQQLKYYIEKTFHDFDSDKDITTVCGSIPERHQND